MPTADPFYLRYLPNSLRERLTGRHNLFAVLHNSGWLVGEKVFKAVVAIVVTAWVARYLGPTEYGKLSYILAIVAFFQAITPLGLDGIVVRELATNKEEAGVLLGTTFMMRILAGIVCWVGLVLFMLLVYGWSENTWLSLFIGGSLLFQSADTIDLWFQSQTQSRRTVLAKFIAILVSSSLRVVFILLKLPLIYFALAFFVEFGVIAVALYFSYQRYPCSQQWLYHFKERGKNLLKESWPFVVSAVAIIIYMRIDQVMIKYYLGEKELGIYSAVVLFSTGWYMVGSVLYYSLVPIFSKKFQIDQSAFERQLAIVFRLLILLGLSLSLLTAWQAKNIINIALGNDYLSGIGVLQIHVFSVIPVLLGIMQGIWILNMKKPTLFLKQTIAGGFVSVIGNLILIPAYGTIGASINVVLSQIVSTLGVNLLIENKLFLLQIGVKFKG